VIVTDRLELIPVADLLDLLSEGRHEEAEHALGVTIPDGWPDAHDQRFFAYRARQLAADPEDRDWMPQLIVLHATGRPMIGHAGFHGKPGKNARDDTDAVELGYMIFAEHRRRGYATEAVRALIQWAAADKAIRRFLASIGPQNAPSLALANTLGFVEVGRHWDDQDGDELEFMLELA
jgi:RimJ/RimL family protein N-acetyltransferase